MESYVLSTREQQIHIASLERIFCFEAYEPIHLEYSFKFLHSDIDYLCSSTGYSPVKHFTDSGNYFTDSLWQVVKQKK